MAKVKDKYELIDELYGLRAGLSVYSQETDNLAKIEDESWVEELAQLNIASDVRGIGADGVYYRKTPFQEVEILNDNNYPEIKKLIEENNLDMRIYSSDGPYSYTPEEATPEKEKKSDEQYRIAEKVYEKWLFTDEMDTFYLELRKGFSLREMEHEQKDLDIFGPRKTKRFFNAFLMLLLTVGMTVVFFLFGLPRDDFWEWVMLGGIVLFAVLFLVALPKYLRLRRTCARVRKKVKQLKWDSEHPEKSEKMLAVYSARERLKTLIAERENKVYPYIVKLDNFYKALQKEYAPVIDERNWKNLDLIIFALETGRADNLKEALQFADGELRTRRIEKAIEKATSQICSTIRSGFASLEATIQSCCARLSAQIQDIGGKILATNQQILSTQREMLSEQRLSNALLAKANVTSTQLMDDVHKIRSNSDYLNMRLRVG